MIDGAFLEEPWSRWTRKEKLRRHTEFTQLGVGETRTRITGGIMIDLPVFLNGETTVEIRQACIRLDIPPRCCHASHWSGSGVRACAGDWYNHQRFSAGFATGVPCPPSSQLLCPLRCPRTFPLGSALGLALRRQP